MKDYYELVNKKRLSIFLTPLVCALGIGFRRSFNCSGLRHRSFALHIIVFEIRFYLWRA
jgi:hypothetical protein